MKLFTTKCLWIDVWHEWKEIKNVQRYQIKFSHLWKQTNNIFCSMNLAWMCIRDEKKIYIKKGNFPYKVYSFFIWTQQHLNDDLLSNRLCQEEGGGCEGEMGNCVQFFFYFVLPFSPKMMLYTYYHAWKKGFPVLDKKKCFVFDVDVYVATEKKEHRRGQIYLQYCDWYRFINDCWIYTLWYSVIFKFQPQSNFCVIITDFDWVARVGIDG